MPEEQRRAPPDNLSEGWPRARPDPLGEYERHPAALAPPPYSPKRFRDLVAGTREKGQQYPVELYAGTRLVLRGWHMLLACRELGIAPRTIEVAGPSYPEVRTDEQVEVYTAAESAGRGWTPSERALYTKEVVLPAFAARAGLRMARGRALTEAEMAERGTAVFLACAETNASATYVKNLVKVERLAPALYARVRDAILAGDATMNVNKAMQTLRAGTGDDGVWREPAPALLQRAPQPQVVDPIPPDLYDLRDELDVETRAQAIDVLLQFREAEADAWERFLGQWRGARGR